MAKIIYFILKHIIKYRAAVITKNIKFIFTDIADDEAETIKRDFYIYLANLLLGFFGGNWSTHKKKLVIDNPEIIEQYYSRSEPVFIIFSHYSHWEMAAQAPLFIKRPCISAYKPLKNKIFDAIARKNRQAWGGKMINNREISRHIIKNKKQNIFYFFLADQYPSASQVSMEVKFFNKQVRFLSGMETIARKINCPVLYMDIGKVEQDVVHARFIELATTAATLADGQITQKMAAELERQIKTCPALWPLSHRRFKDQINYRSPT